jgi:hypothetical protein
MRAKTIYAGIIEQITNDLNKELIIINKRN